MNSESEQEIRPCSKKPFLFSSIIGSIMISVSLLTLPVGPFILYYDDFLKHGYIFALIEFIGNLNVWSWSGSISFILFFLFPVPATILGIFSLLVIYVYPEKHRGKGLAIYTCLAGGALLFSYYAGWMIAKYGYGPCGV